MIGSIIYLAIVVIVIAGMWKTFEKAGQPGWVYQLYKTGTNRFYLQQILRARVIIKNQGFKILNPSSIILTNDEE